MEVIYLPETDHDQWNAFTEYSPQGSLFSRTWYLDALGVEAPQAVALEDSPNGVLAAKRAGIYCVAVPNAITRQLDLHHADLCLESLADPTLAE